MTSFQDTGHPPPAIIDKDGRECVGGRAAFIRLVEDLPVTQLAPTTQTDTASSDSAQWESQQRKLPAGEHARKLHGTRSGSRGSVVQGCRRRCRPSLDGRHGRAD